MTTIITIITIITTTIAMTITYTSFFFLTLLISAAIPIFSRTLKTNQRFEVSAGRLWECIDSGTSGDIDHLLHRMPAGGVLDVVDPGKIGRMTATPPGKDGTKPFKALQSLSNSFCRHGRSRSSIKPRLTQPPIASITEWITGSAKRTLR